MLLYDAIQSYENVLSVSPYTGISMICLSYWGENEICSHMLDEKNKCVLFTKKDILGYYSMYSLHHNKAQRIGCVNTYDMYN
jgi:hypothetical protein